MKKDILDVYTKPNCPKCTELKEFLRSKEISFFVIDLTVDKVALESIKRAGHGTVPQVYKDGTYVGDGNFTMEAYS